MNKEDEPILMSPYGDFLGIELQAISPGRALCTIELKDHHLNNGGRVHGGVLTSLADTAAGAGEGLQRSRIVLNTRHAARRYTRAEHAIL